MLPDPHGAAATASSDEDNWSWLVTFSDLVLQLFGFAVIAALAGAAAQHAPVVTAAAVVEPVPESESSPLPAATRMDAPRSAGARAAGDAAVLAGVPAAAEDSLPPARADVLDAVPPPVRERALPAAAATVPAPGPRDARMAALGRYIAQLVSTQPELAASVRNGEDEVVVQVGALAGFAPGSADPRPAMRPLLAELRALVAAAPDLQVVVSGHTDDVPIKTALFPSNLELSLARASRVAHELAGSDPTLWSRISASGFGEQRPLVSNGDAQGRARNRRVEIRLTRAG